MNAGGHNVLVVDNDRSIVWVLEKALSGEGFEVDVAMNGKEALEKVEAKEYSLVIMDIKMPVMDGLTAFRRITELGNPPETIIITAHSSMENTVEAMKLGAFDYIVKPFDIDDVIELAERAVKRYETRNLPETGPPTGTTERIIGDSPVMRELYKVLGRVASTDTSVLITGETGTGKDLFARTIHHYSSRRHGPFITVNCASIPVELLESELFGHERGAFTGAVARRIGKCELADGGTLFLDEIGAMRLDLQAKLLRFLQHSEFERVGSSKTQRVDVRVIAATNENLKELTERGMFRKDLYYRLMVVPIYIPPLRERREDIPALAKYFVDYYNVKYDLNFKLTDEHISALQSKDWPGNVRELENYIHRTVVLQSDTMDAVDGFPAGIPAQFHTDGVEAVVSALLESGLPDLLDAARAAVEKPLLMKVMSRARNNRSEAAKILGISRNTLNKMLAKYGIPSRKESG